MQAAAMLGLQDAHHMLQVQHEEYVALLDEARAKIFVLEGRLEEYANMQIQAPAAASATAPIASSSLENGVFKAVPVLSFLSNHVTEMQAGAQSFAVEAELKALKAESTRIREEKLAKEKELTDVRLELATLRRTSEVSVESLKTGIFFC